MEDEDRDEENRLQEEFRDLVAAMESYLRPIMEPIESSLRLLTIISSCHDQVVVLWWDGLSDRSLMVDPLSYFSGY